MRYEVETTLAEPAGTVPQSLALLTAGHRRQQPNQSNAVDREKRTDHNPISLLLKKTCAVRSLKINSR